MNNQLVSIIPLGGIGNVTRNMYVYECGNEILIVDCGLGFPDETMLGVDLLLPDITYLLQTKKRIVGMVLTHGHEDHIGALPYLLPQLPEFPIFGTPFTAALANEKLKEFNIKTRVTSTQFEHGYINHGTAFKTKFIRVTHSIPDTSHIVIQTPVGVMYHGSDYKFDDTPFDQKKSDYGQIQAVGNQGVLLMLSDSLGAEKKGRIPTELTLLNSFDNAIASCKGKFIVTTYSSNIARLNQIIQVSEKVGRHVCFVGRSLTKTKEVGQRMGYLHMKQGTEVRLDEVRNIHDSQLTLIVAGSQGQENSAMSRIADGLHRDVKLTNEDVVIFSSDPIPGNEVTVYELIDTLAKKGVRTLYSPVTKDFHVSGHGGIDEISELMKLVKPKKLIPIGGQYRHMFAYQQIAMANGYKKTDVLLLDDGQEVIVRQTGITVGRTIPVKNVYVDEISGEELESVVLRDRQKLSEGGVVIILAEVDAMTGQLVRSPDVIMKGFMIGEDTRRVIKKIQNDIQKTLRGRKGRVTNWVHLRKLIGEVSERRFFQDFRRRPLVLPVVIEV